MISGSDPLTDLSLVVSDGSGWSQNLAISADGTAQFTLPSDSTAGTIFTFTATATDTAGQFTSASATTEVAPSRM